MEPGLFGGMRKLKGVCPEQQDVSPHGVQTITAEVLADDESGGNSELTRWLRERNMGNGLQ